MGRRLALILVMLAGGAVAVQAASAHRLPKAPKCPILPHDNHFNKRVDKLPVASNSATMIASIGREDTVHADFGSGTYNGGPIGIPYTVVKRSQRKVPVSFEESDRGKYPIAPKAPIEGGPNADGDRHVLVVDRDRCRLYELYDAHPSSGGASWHAGSGAVFNLRSNKLRPSGWTSADAAGLPILPGLARYHEAKRGSINHALRFTARQTRRAFVYPARHFASSSDDPTLPPMGLRIRMKAATDRSGLGKQARIVARALKRYGALLADNGSPWYFSGAPDKRWNNDDLHTLGTLEGSDFEVVDASSLPRPGT